MDSSSLMRLDSSLISLVMSFLSFSTGSGYQGGEKECLHKRDVLKLEKRVKD